MRRRQLMCRIIIIAILIFMPAMAAASFTDELLNNWGKVDQYRYLYYPNYVSDTFYYWEFGTDDIC